MTTSRIDLQNLVDLALGTPEIGAVNFNVLHALLHAIVKLLHVEDVQVQLVGIPINSNSIPHCVNEPSQWTVQEYKVEGSNEILIEETTETVGRLFIVKKYDRSGNEIQRVDAEQNISKVVDDSKTNEENECVKEACRKKMNSPLQAISHTDFESGNFLQNFKNLELRMNNSETKLTQLEHSLEENNNKLTQKIECLHKNLEEDRKLSVDDNGKRLFGGSTNCDAILNEIQTELDSLKTEVIEIKEKLNKETFSKETLDEHILKDDVCLLKSTDQFIYKEHNNLLSDCRPLELPITCPNQNYCGEITQNLNNRVEILNIKFITLNDQFLDIEKQLCNLVDNFQNNSQNINVDELIAKSHLQDDFNNQKKSMIELMQKIDLLMNEKYELNKQIRDLTQILEEVSENKLDKQDIEEMLSEKADYTMLQRKVSVEYFETQKRNMDATVNDIFDQLQQRDGLWKTALEDMMNKIELKADSDDIASLKEYMNNKVERMWERMNTSFNTRGTEPEAAGASVKLMRNLNCISCAQNVMMKTEEASRFPRSDALKGSTIKSSKPILNYQLDKIAKIVKNLSFSRNMNHYESICKSNKQPTQEKINRPCNRYCGGSHTVINSRSKVERTRHLGLTCVPTRKPICVCRSQETTVPPNQQDQDTVDGEPPEICLSHCDQKETCSNENERMLLMCKNDEDFFKMCTTQESRGTAECNLGSEINTENDSDDVKRREVCKQYIKEFYECKKLKNEKLVTIENDKKKITSDKNSKTSVKVENSESRTSFKEESLAQSQSQHNTSGDNDSNQHDPTRKTLKDSTLTRNTRSIHSADPTNVSTIPGSIGEEGESFGSLTMDLEIEEEFSQRIDTIKHRSFYTVESEHEGEEFESDDNLPTLKDEGESLNEQQSNE